ncbi:MAG: hypothetical protein G01um10143_716 [Parcubacteria group bacterium Gr01-1014_3]|nr:MAG: hypothetical protein G01um10143_716 [Parcubacteria group bacterium Gr01-1014_3]
MATKSQIVILGAGFGGLHAAITIGKQLRRYKLDDKYEVILVDRNDFQTYTPTLYEAATTSKETANYLDLKSIITIPVQTAIKGLPVNFIKGEITKLDLMNGDIHLAREDQEEQIRYEYLLLALGAETNYFNIKGLKENSLPLKTFYDSIKIRDRVLELFAEKPHIKIVIGGGGSTGVELAGEIRQWLGELKKELSPQCNAAVSIVDAGPRILGPFSERISRKATKRLTKLGVEIVNNSHIAKVQPQLATLEDGKEIPFDLLVWTGGVKSSSLMETMPLKTEPKGRVVVENEMNCLPQTPDLKLYGKVYGIGDAICFMNPKTGKAMPGVARAAISQATIAAKNIIGEILERENKATRVKRYIFRPMDYPYVIPIGGKYAIAKIGPILISGFLGWFIKGLVELNYLLSIMPLEQAIKTWFKGLRIFIKNDRLG